MAKMHELIAVNNDVKGQANKVFGDLIGLFNGKKHHFTRKIVTFKPLGENQVQVTESQSSIQATLDKEIPWAGNYMAKAIDSGYQIDKGNTLAKADLVLEGGPTIPNLPATALMQLEKHVQHIKTLAEAIPTLDPSQNFVLDPAAGKGIYRAADVNKKRTKKVMKNVVLAVATKEHKEQVIREAEDEVTGDIQEQEWSSLTTPSIKADIIGRCDTLLQAIKKALSRANSQEVDGADKIGKTILDYVFKPLTT